MSPTRIPHAGSAKAPCSHREHERELKPLAFAIVAALGLTASTLVHAAPLIIDAGGVYPAISAPMTVDAFWIGENVSGNLVTIAAPGGAVTVTAGNSTALGVNAGSNGNSLAVNGTMSVTDGTLVGYRGATNVMTVAGTVVTGEMKVGVLGSATSNTLTVNAGGSLTNSGVGELGATAGADGNAVTVTGAGATWQSTGTLSVGSVSRSNSLTVANGGSVTHVADALIGGADGADGNTLTVTGALSSLKTTNGTLYIGRGGANNGALVNLGGTLQSRNVRIGGGTGRSGTPTGNHAVVDGSGSTWSVLGTLRVGSGGSPGVADTGSALTVSGGGILTVAGNSFLGYDATSTANTLTVEGAGSSAALSALIIGKAAGSTGNRVIVADTAALDAASIDIGESSGLEIGAGGLPGVVSVGSGNIAGAGAGAYVRFDHSATNYTFGVNLTGTVRVAQVGPGLTTLTGTNTYTGATDVSAGVLNFGIGSPSTLASANVSGSGTLAVQSGVLLSMNGNYAQTGQGHLRTYITGPSTYGRLFVGGTASLASGSSIDVTSSICPTLAVGQVFPSVVASTNTVSLGALRVDDNCADYDFEARLNNAGNGVDLVVIAAPTTAIPTLSQWGLILLSSMLGLAAFRRLRVRRA